MTRLTRRAAPFALAAALLAAASAFAQQQVLNVYNRAEYIAPDTLANFEKDLGLPIVASDGRMLGRLAFVDAVPRGGEMLVDSICRIFLARAAAEIERGQAPARLAETQAKDRAAAA